MYRVKDELVHIHNFIRKKSSITHIYTRSKLRIFRQSQNGTLLLTG